MNNLKHKNFSSFNTFKKTDFETPSSETAGTAPDSGPDRVEDGVQHMAERQL